MEQVSHLRQQYTAGKKVKLNYINDQTARIKRGDTGTIRLVDDIGQIHVDWDSGSTIALHYDEDDFELI